MINTMVHVFCDKTGMNQRLLIRSSRAAHFLIVHLFFGFIFPFGMFDTPAGNNRFAVDHMKFFVQNFEAV